MFKGTKLEQHQSNTSSQSSSILAMSLCLVVSLMTFGNSAFAQTTDRKPVPKTSKPQVRKPYQEPVEQTMKRIDDSQKVLKAYAEHFSTNWNSLDADSFPMILEGLATETVLAEIIRSVYTEALRQGWRTADRYNIFPIHQSAMNSQIRDTIKFNANGARVAVFGLRMGKRVRGIILTSHYRPTFPGELERQYRSNQIHDSLMSARETYNLYAGELIERMKSRDPRVSEYLPLKTESDSWVLGCEKTINDKFCVNARVFDSNDTRTDIFYDTLMGHIEEDPRLRAIKATKLAWPVKDSYISRGFKVECSRCDRNHYGLDLATPKGTLIHSIQSGTVIKLGNLSGWGRTAVIEHSLPNGDRFVSLYAHLSQFKKGLRVGQTVDRGEMIARSGNTGHSTGPHLHMEIRYAPDGRESIDTLRQPRSQVERPLDPLRVLDVFNIFVDGE